MPPKRLTFTREPDHQVEELAGAVLAGLNGNKAFPTLPVDLATVQTQLTDFTTSVSAASQGGPHATAVKKKKRHALLASLRQLALYVQSNCNDDMATLLSSGFLAASTCSFFFSCRRFTDADKRIKGEPPFCMPCCIDR